MNLLARITNQQTAERSSSGWSTLDPWALQPNWLYGSMAVRQIDQPEAFEDFVSFVHEQDNVVSAAVVARAFVMSQVRFAWRNTIREGDRYRQLFGNQDLALLERPDPGRLTRPVMLNAAETHASYAGAAYIVRHGDHLELLDPGLVDVVLAGVEDRYTMLTKRAGVKLGYVYWREGRYMGANPEQYALEEVIHWTPEPNPLRWWTGTSWVSSLLQEVSLDKASTRYLREFFEKAATPNLIVKPHESLTAEQLDTYREVFAKEYAGVRNSFKTMWLGGGSDVTVVGSKLADLDLKSLQGGLETRIAVRSRVPAAILGVREGLSGSALNAGNYAATRRLWADSWFAPSVQSLCAAVEAAFPPPAGSEMWYDPDDVLLLQEDAQDAAQIMATHATALQALDSAGYGADAAVAAVRDGNLSALIGAHDGLQSVQRLPTDSGDGGNSDG